MGRFRRPVDGALFMRAKGFKVFPLIPNGKTPAMKNWQDWAEQALEKKVIDYGTANPSHNWGVYCGPSMLAVIDLDVKNGATGLDDYKALVAASGQGHLNTFRVKTPSGGWHLYYSDFVRSCKLTKSIDVQSKGKYVVCPGSIIEDKQYEIFDNSPREVAPLPRWLKLKIEEKAHVEPKTIQDNEPIIEGDRNITFISLAGTMRRRGFDYNAILAALKETNNRTSPPLTDKEIENIASTAAAYKPEEAETMAAFEPIQRIKAYRACDLVLENIPKRNWIMQNRFIGGFISALIAPGGLGKSTLSIADAVAVVTGKPLTGFDVLKPGGVWVYNTEDPKEEVERRLGAFCIQNEIPLSVLDKFFYSSSKEQPLIVARTGRDGIKVNKEAIEFAVGYIRDNAIVLMIVDPFVRVHECNENNNMEIDKVVQCFQQIADRTGCAVCFVHHTSKGGALANSQTTDPDMYSARGATALINAARIAHVLSTMTEEEARLFQIPETRRRWYVRLDNAKANLQPPAEYAEWYEKVSIALPNEEFIGSLKKCDIKTAKKATPGYEESAKGEALNLGKLLYDLLIPGDPGKEKISTGDLVEVVECDIELAGDVFSNPRMSKQDKQRRVQELVMENRGIIYKDKAFKHLHTPLEKKKHWVIATVFEPGRQEPEVPAETPAPATIDNFLAD